MKLSKREMTILWVTLSVILTVGLWTWGISPVWDAYTQLTADVEAEQQKFEKNRKTLAEAPEIERQYKAIEASFGSDDEDVDPEKEFSESIVFLAEDILGKKLREYGTVQREVMKGVKDYEFLTYSAKASGELPKIAELLKGFDQKGYMVRTISLVSQLDKPEMQLDMTLERVVRVPEEEDLGPRRRGLGRRI